MQNPTHTHCQLHEPQAKARQLAGQDTFELAAGATGLAPLRRRLLPIRSSPSVPRVWRANRVKSVNSVKSASFARPLLASPRRNRVADDYVHMLASLTRCPAVARCTAVSARSLVCAPPPPPPPDVKCATTNDIPGHEITAYLGMVEGSTVRTKNVAHDVFASVKQVMGGELTSYTDLLREARAEAMQRMNAQAAERGANAIIGVRMTSSSVAAGASEILAYGTAVMVKEQ